MRLGTSMSCMSLSVGAGCTRTSPLWRMPRWGNDRYLATSGPRLFHVERRLGHMEGDRNAGFVSYGSASAQGLPANLFGGQAKLRVVLSNGASACAVQE